MRLTGSDVSRSETVVRRSRSERKDIALVVRLNSGRALKFVAEKVSKSARAEVRWKDILEWWDNQTTPNYTFKDGVRTFRLRRDNILWISTDNDYQSVVI